MYRLYGLRVPYNVTTVQQHKHDDVNIIILMRAIFKNSSSFLLFYYRVNRFHGARGLSDTFYSQNQ